MRPIYVMLVLAGTLFVGQEAIQIEHGVGKALTVTFGSAPSTIFLGGDKGDVLQWDFASKEKKQVAKLRGPVGTLVANEATGLLVVVRHTGDLIIHGLDDLREKRQKKLHPNGEIFSAAICSKARLLITGSNRDVGVWDLDTLDQYCLFEGHQHWVEAVLVSQDGDTVVSASVDKMVRIWNTKTKRTVAVLEGHKSTVRGLVWGPDESTVVSVGVDGQSSFGT